MYYTFNKAVLLLGGIKMALSVIIGLVLAFVAIISAFVLDGGHIGALLEPTAALIVLGGTIGAVIVSTPAGDLKRIGGILGVVFKNKESNLGKLISYFKNLTILSRKEGLLTLEKEVPNAEAMDPFIAKGLAMAVDGTEPQKVKEIMENQIYLTFERHKSGINIFEAAGGFAPTMGIIGTVTGLVHILGNLDDPKELGPKIAVAFIATLYGIGTANLIWLPIANRLKALNKIENLEKELIMEAIISIQEGTSPNLLEEKLSGFLGNNKDDKNSKEGENEKVTK
jgi:chemotaxis protein MotA